MLIDSVEPTYTPAQRETIYRRNFFFFLIDGTLFMVAINIIGTSTVIPDFIRHLTNSEVLIGLSGSLFDIGWLMPQLFVARYVVRASRKKWWFVGPNIPVRFVILVFGVLIALLGKDRTGLILVAFLVCYGIAAVGDGLVGVPWADLTGSSLDNRWRARFFGLMSALTGLIMLALAPVIGHVLSESGPEFPNNYALLFGSAGVLFALSILPTLFLHELPGGKAVEAVPPLREFLPDLGRVLRDDSPFRAMVIVRTFSNLFIMAGPFYIGFATTQLGLTSASAVPVFLSMQTVGALSGALLYSWIGARHNLLYIRMALGVGTLLPISALLASVVGPVPLYIGFFVSGLVVMNLFMSYLNWVVSYATPEQRPIYTGLFNTVAAVTSLLSPLLAGTIAQVLGYEVLFFVALLMALCALYVTLRYVRNPKSQ
ncbi:MAG: MFS transporter [Anaerolineaceae bacterium]|nr:MFS transporter [Anaerolineaceae bacterium]